MTRLRIAPSPTGNLHVGTARAALFNWLYARHTAGTFIVRIDDTDVTRSTQEFEKNILGGLRWLGIDWDEGVEVGGPHGSYRQSSRFDRYGEVARTLVSDGHAYFDDRAPEELEALRTRAQKEGLHPGHYIRRPDAAFDSGSIRFSVPDAPVEFVDLVRDEMRFEGSAVDDFVLLRSDGTPTYHLASTVDDVDYEITHVARGEDLLSSTPKHILLTRALDREPPAYAHLPLLFGADGKKLSKRHGDTSVDEFRQAGYLAEAMANYLSLLGWSPGEDLTIFDRELAVERFDLANVQKNPAIFDLDKLAWVNGEYVRALDIGSFVELVRPLIADKATVSGRWEAFVALAPVIQERTQVLTDVIDQSAFLFTDDLAYDEKSWAKVMAKDGVAEVLDAALADLAQVEPWETAAIEESLRAVPERLGLGLGNVFQPIRVAVTGSSVSPPLFESLEALGPDRSLTRLKAARALL